MNTCPVFILLVFINFTQCRDFYVGMFKKNDFLVAQDKLYKAKVPYRTTFAQYGRVFKCPITYFRVVDRLGMGRGPRVQIIRGGLRKKFITLRLTSGYNLPISVNIYVGCENKQKPKTKKTTTKPKTTKSTTKSTTTKTTEKPKTTKTTSKPKSIEEQGKDTDKDKDKGKDKDKDKKDDKNATSPAGISTTKQGESNSEPATTGKTGADNTGNTTGRGTTGTGANTSETGESSKTGGDASASVTEPSKTEGSSNADQTTTTSGATTAAGAV